MKRLFCLLSALALLLLPVHAAQPPQRYLALTFDDGPSGELTEQLLEGLAARQVRVTFFVCGYRVEEFPDTLRHIAAGGHEIGLHSSRHDYMQKMDYAAALQDLTSCMQTVEDCCGVRARLFRPPGGLYSDALLQAAKDADLSVILWSVDPCDWDEAAWDGVLPTVLSEAHDGRIILMHDLSAHSVTCALQAIDRLMAQGYSGELARRTAERLELDDDEESEALDKTIAKALRLYASRVEGSRLQQKIVAYCLQKGFPSDMVRQRLEEREWNDNE